MAKLYIRKNIIIPLVLALFTLLEPQMSSGQTREITGAVRNGLTEEALEGVTVTASRAVAVTDEKGLFSISVANSGDTLSFSSVGYKPKRIPIGPGSTKPLNIYLQSEDNLLRDVVVSTGYYQLSKERATGSFFHLNNELINRNPDGNIINRLEGITGSLQFDKRNLKIAVSSRPELRVRGLSTINAETAPLIVLDNFPYEGDIGDINPDDVESVTVLKDAAAASIWGARAGNGVIVIDSKLGKFNQPVKVHYSSSVRIKEHPDLFYSPRFIPAAEFIEVERELFSRGNYAENDWTALSPTVELFIKERDGMISPEQLAGEIARLKGLDIRRQASEYLYQTGLDQQHALSMSGGSDRFRFYFSGGLNNEKGSIKGFKTRRLSLNSRNTYMPVEDVELTVGIDFDRYKAENNGLYLSNLNPLGKSAIYPYAQLIDEEGNFLSVPKNYVRSIYVDNAQLMGLLDWAYRPLQEKSLLNSSEEGQSIKIAAGLKFNILNSFDLDVNYLYFKEDRFGRVIDHAESYAVRDMVNQFLQDDGTSPFPQGGILHSDDRHLTTHSGRVQLNYNKQFGAHHDLSALAGTELRQHVTEGNQYSLYGYDDDILTFQQNVDYVGRYPTNPRGLNRSISPPSASLSHFTDRYLSYYANASYTYLGKYIASGSARWDASNYFGVKTNQKGVPLWSGGLAWLLHEEPFLHIPAINKLKVRATYGYNGNTRKASSAQVVARYSTDRTTGLTQAVIRNPGDPSLRWEKIGIFDIGLDMVLFSNKVSASVDYYNKNGIDLIGNSLTDPTSGWDSQDLLQYFTNYANLNTRGFDIELVTRNADKEIKWTTSILASLVKNKVTNYEVDHSANTASYLSSAVLPKEGYSLDQLYSLPWHGLSPSTGDPQVEIDGQITHDNAAYSKYINSLSFDGLINSGVSMPPFFGAVRNDFRWKNFTASVNITWKAGYNFRRISINYKELFDSWEGHTDYLLRWQKPGDELKTNVPSFPVSSNSSRETVYNKSEVLIEKGDHIRLQDVIIGYDMNDIHFRSLSVKKVRIFMNISNIGLIWKAGESDLDPDYPGLDILPGRITSFGIQVNL